MTYPIVVPDLEVYAGDTFAQSYVFKTNAVPIDLSAWSGWVAKWQPYQGGTSITLTVTTTGLAVGSIVVNATSAQTTAMGGPGLWDVSATNNGSVRTFLRGKTHYTEDVPNV